MKPVILVVDDEEAIRLFLEATLEDAGYEVITAARGNEAIEKLGSVDPDLVLLDLMLPDLSGMEILEIIRKTWPHLCVIMLTAYSATDSVVQAMKLDAHDYIAKPIQLDRLLEVVARALEASADERHRRRQRTQHDLFRDVEDIVPSRAPEMLALYDVIRRISDGDSTTVLIQGESGVGKDVVANIIHRTSPRRDYPFLEINCAALPEQLLESELFGHEKGAFTDAVTQKLGLLELAHSGTLFLDEIGEMSLPIQVKLLRVLEKMSFRRVGGLQDVSVDVRIIAATNRDLASLVRHGTFREDLYYRLKVLLLQVPPLRLRPEDIEPLAAHFVAGFAKKFKKDFDGLAPGALRLMQAYPWPGNIRELKNVIERAVLLEDGPVLKADHLQLTETEPANGLAERLQEVLDQALPADGIELETLVGEFERALVHKAYRAAGGNKSQAARLLGLNRDKFRYRWQQYGTKDEA